VTTVTVQNLKERQGETVTIRGWLARARSSGKIAFLQVRDGARVVQCVVSRNEVPEAAWEDAKRVTQESTLEVTGRVNVDERAPGGVEIHAADLRILAESEEFPITPKDHGTAFLMEHRHLWLRSSRQRAALKVRSELCQAIRDFFHQREFVLIDSPILTPAACEGTSTLFETDYFGEQAYLSQSGQLYLEPAAAAFGKVYCFGPTFRAEKSKTRRHLTEFWMVEPEVAFLEFEGLVGLAEEFVSGIVGRVLERCAEEMKVLERDTSQLENATSPFPRITYTEAVELLRAEKDDGFVWGEDFGAEDETIIGAMHEGPVVITHFPASFKAFYMEPVPDDDRLVLAMDIIAPEGYGEIIGGSQRIHDHDLLLKRIEQHDLPREAFQWYLDIRRYGTFPHSGFGMGIERVVAWLCGLSHVRETIPYPRMLYRIYP